MRGFSRSCHGFAGSNVRNPYRFQTRRSRLTSSKSETHRQALVGPTHTSASCLEGTDRSVLLTAPRMFLAERGLLPGFCNLFASHASSLEPHTIDSCHSETEIAYWFYYRTIGATMTRHRYVTIDKTRIFYRESGKRGAPVLLLLHGFPGSSFMFRDLLTRLAGDFHI